ncbi:heavy-metal-associated domain-containing protein [Niallia sp. Krafla_26]|uniref:heavy-metal-associated domain-containing protein n=1 Tax=Niallia sp. Krafla_26 TaxID=3064703 RepID=UPI003D164C8E
MEKSVFQVGPFECAGCAKKLENQLKDTAGVISVKVFPHLCKIRTEFDEKKISIKQLEEFLRKWGYPIQTQAHTLSNKGRKIS